MDCRMWIIVMDIVSGINYGWWFERWHTVEYKFKPETRVDSIAQHALPSFHSQYKSIQLPLCQPAGLDADQVRYSSLRSLCSTAQGEKSVSESWDRKQKKSKIWLCRILRSWEGGGKKNRAEERVEPYGLYFAALSYILREMSQRIFRTGHLYSSHFKLVLGLWRLNTTAPSSHCS